MLAQPSRSLMSVEQYLELDSSSMDVRYEYIDGYASMMAGGTLDHSSIAINLASILHGFLRNGPCRFYNTDVKVRLSETRFVFPDLSITCDARDRGRGRGRVDTIQYPCVIVEVLSPGTEAYDRGKKFSYYRACPTIQEYVLIDSEQQAVEVFQRETSNLWTLHPFGPGDQVELVSLNVSFTIDALYEKAARGPLLSSRWVHGLPPEGGS